MDMLNQRYRILSWNVRELNSAAKQEDVRQIINLFKPDLVYFQETKLASFDAVTIRICLGREYENSYTFLTADGTRGGIVLAARSFSMIFSTPFYTNHTLSAQVLDIRSNHTSTVAIVYEPQGDLEKCLFICGLRNIKQTASPHWLVLGDFNFYKDQDKNNGRVNRRLMNSFARALNHMEVREIQLNGRKYTWSSNQSTPTLTCIERAFCTLAWEDFYAQPHIQTLSSSTSDHSLC
jgi:exonuclease III